MPAAAMERVVRPFVADAPARRTPRAEPAQDADEALLEWTASMRVNTTVVPGRSWSIVPKEKDEDHEETDRKVIEERIENPDDPEQYVIVEKIDEVTFTDPTGVSRRYILKTTSRQPA